MLEPNGQIDKGIFIEQDINNIPTSESIKLKVLLELIEKQMPSFSPEKVKGLVK